MHAFKLVVLLGVSILVLLAVLGAFSLLLNPVIAKARAQRRETGQGWGRGV